VDISSCFAISLRAKLRMAIAFRFNRGWFAFGPSPASAAGLGLGRIGMGNSGNGDSGMRSSRGSAFVEIFGPLPVLCSSLCFSFCSSSTLKFLEVSMRTDFHSSEISLMPSAESSMNEPLNSRGSCLVRSLLIERSSTRTRAKSL
jgi:hypothetical protein